MSYLILGVEAPDGAHALSNHIVPWRAFATEPWNLPFTALSTRPLAIYYSSRCPAIFLSSGLPLFFYHYSVESRTLIYNVHDGLAALVLYPLVVPDMYPPVYHRSSTGQSPLGASKTAQKGGAQESLFEGEHCDMTNQQLIRPIMPGTTEVIPFVTVFLCLHRRPTVKGHESWMFQV